MRGENPAPYSKPLDQRLGTLLIRAGCRLASQVGPDIVRQGPISQTNPIVLRVGDLIDRCAGANDQATRFRSTPILQIVPDLHSGLEGSGATGAHERLGRTLDYSDLAGKDIDHFVLRAVPMLDRGSAAGLEDLNERTKLRKFSGLANPKRLIRRRATLHSANLADQLIRREDRH